MDLVIQGFIGSRFFYFGRDRAGWLRDRTWTLVMNRYLWIEVWRPWEPRTIQEIVDEFGEGVVLDELEDAVAS